MAHLNKVFLLGNLTRDPDRRSLPSGSTVTELRLAVTRKYRLQSGESKEETLFITVTIFGKGAETAAKYLQKGRPVLIEGRLRLEEWTGKDGQRQSRISVVAENFQLLGGGDRPPRTSEMGDAPSAYAGRRESAPENPGDPGESAPASFPEPAADEDNLPF